MSLTVPPIAIPKGHRIDTPRLPTASLVLKLTFFKDGGEKVDLVLTGKDESELLEKWNELPHWAAWGPDRFRWRLVEFSGADKEKYTKTPVQMPAPDEEILAAVVDALGPRSVKLEHEGDQG